MLQTLRKGASTWVVRLFLGILMVSFGIGIWQGNSLFRSSKDDTVASVGGTDVATRSFQIAFDRELRRLQTQLGGAFTREQALTFNVQGAVLSELISDATVTEAARSFGMRVPDDLVAREIAALPAFQDFTGKFDAARFGQVLRQAGMTEAMLTDQVRRELLRAQLYGPAASGARTPEVVAAALYRYQNERRVIDYFTVAPAAVGKVPTPDQAAIDDYYKANPQAFTAPEYRAVTLLVVDPAAVAKTVTPSEDEIAAAYEEHKAEYVVEEQRDIQQMVLKTKEEGDAALAKLQAGADFAAVAKETAGVAEADTKLGLVTKDGLPLELADAVFGAAEGAVGGPVESPLGFHVFKVLKVVPGTTKPLAEVHDQLRDGLALEGATGKVAEIGKSLQDEMAGGATLEEAGQRLNLPVLKVAAIDSNSLDADGKPVEGLPKAETLLSSLFQAESGRDGDMLDTEGGGYVIGRVDSVTPAALRPLDTVKDKVIAAWQSQERKTLQKKLADDLVAAVNGGKAIEEAAKSIGAVPGTVGPGTRSNDPIFAALPPALVKALFGLDKGKATAAPAADGDDMVVAAVKSIEVSDPAADAAGVKAVAEKMRGDYAGDLAAIFESDLRERFGLHINETVFAALTSRSAP